MDGDKKDGMCGGCNHGHMHGHWIVKKIFLLIILIAVFCFGVQLGELRTLAKIFREPSYRMIGAYGNNWNTSMMPARQNGTSTKGW